MATYNTLIAQVTSWLQRSGNDAATIAAIPQFISLAEDGIASDYENAGFIKVVTKSQRLESFRDGVYCYVKPSRWRRNLNFNYGKNYGGDVQNNTRVTLYQKEYGDLIDYWPNRTLTGAPKFYAEYDYVNWIIAPTPNDYYPFEVRYIEAPAPLSQFNQTNWLTQFAYGLLFYRTLMEAAPFLKNYNEIQILEQQYNKRLNSLIIQDKSRISDASTVVQAVT